MQIVQDKTSEGLSQILRRTQGAGQIRGLSAGVNRVGILAGDVPVAGAPEPCFCYSQSSAGEG
jgi:hypothetical protein